MNKMRAFRAISRNAFKNSGTGGATASLPAGFALALTGAVVFAIILGAWVYSIRWWFMGPKKADNIIVINATDTFTDYAASKDFTDYHFIYIDHPYVFDVATFNTLMDAYDSHLTVVFDEHGDILTFYPTDDLEYTDDKNDFKSNVLDDYSLYLTSLTGAPVSYNNPVNLMEDGISSPEGDSEVTAFLKTLAFMLIPLLYFIAALYSSMTKGTNVIAGAKEQNSFAAILMTPAPRSIIVLGNIFGVWLSSMIPAIVISVPLIFIKMYRPGILPSLVMMAFLSFFIASLVVLISVMSSNIITAQTAFLPIFLIFVTLCITCMQNPDEYLGIYEYLPLYGQYLGIAVSLTTGTNYIALIVSSLVTLLLSGVCVFVSVKLLGSERFTVSVMSASDKEIIKAQKEAARQARKVSRLTTKTSVYGYQATGTLNDVSFSISQIFRPLALLSLFQLIAMVPPLLLTDGEYLTSVMYSLKEVNTVSDVLASGANIIGVLMSTPAFLLSMGFGYILINAYYCFRVKVIERTPLSSGLGLPLQRVLPRYLKGALIGFGMIFTVFGILAVTGQLKVTGFGFAVSSLPLLFSYIFMWIFQGACEEIMFRGYMMPRLASRYGLIPAIAVSSLLFCLFHGINPGFSVLAFINLILISILYALIAYYTESIWIVCAAHTLWNFTQGNICGLEVSGNTGNVSLFHTEYAANANPLITGGTFGPEGGLAVTAVTVIAIVAVIIIFRGKNAKKKG